MSERIPQSVAKLVVFRAYLTSDGKTPATGKTIAITISKNGATSFSNPNAGATNATEMASGFYKFTLDTTDTGTQGPLAWRGAHADIDDAGDCYSVVSAKNAGFSALPDAAADAAGGLPISDAGGLDLDAKLANTNEVTAARMGSLTDWVDGGRLDLILDSRSSHSAADVWSVGTRTLTAATNITTDIATAVWANGTRTLSSFGTLVSDIATAVWAAASRTLTAFGFSVTVGTNSDKTGYRLSSTGVQDIAGGDGDTLETLSDQIEGVHEKTTNLPSDPADQSLLIAAIGMPLQAGSYTAPPTVEEINSELSDTHGSGAWGSDIDEAALAAAVAEALGEELVVNGFTDPAMQQLRTGLRGTLIRVTGPVTESDDEPLTITLVIGDDYLAADGRAIEFDVQDVPDLTDAEITLRLWSQGVEAVVEIEGTATVSTGDTKTIQFEPTASDTADLAETTTKDGKFDVEIIDADDHVIRPLELRGVLKCLKPLGSQ